MPENDDPKTRVGHCIKDDVDEYIGRGNDGDAAMNNTPIFRRGWLGNPYTVAEAPDREAAISKFERDFVWRLESDAKFRIAVASLYGKTLGCWCRTVDENGPPCHGDVIARHARRLGKEMERQPGIPGGAPDLRFMLSQFHEMFEEEQPGRDQQNQQFRFNLLDEEVDEYREHVEADGFDEDGVSEELADIIYTAFGTAVCHDIDLYEQLVRTHAENMAKDSLKTPDHYTEDGDGSQ